MSKIRQAVEYERLLTDQKVHAQRELAGHELGAERELREMSVAYERKMTDAQFGQLEIMADEHRSFHDREHLMYADAITKASTALTSALEAIQVDVDRLRDASHSYLTTERFDREHKVLSEKTELALEVMGEKISSEEKVTVQQKTRDEVLAGIQANADTSRRWMIGLGATSSLSLLALVLHLMRLY